MEDRGKDTFTVAIAIELRAKLERLATGSMRTLGSAAGKLIADADEDDPQWKVRPRRLLEQATPEPAPAAEAQP